MNIHVSTKDIALRKKQHEEIQEHVYLSLWRFEDQIRKIDVYVSDVNGAKGDADMSVVLRVRLRGRAEFTVSALRPALMGAAVVAARKARRRVKRTMNRQRRHQRVGLHQPYAA